MEPETNKVKPIMHVTVDTHAHGFQAGMINQLHRSLAKLKEIYGDHYNIVFSPADVMEVSTSDKNVVRLDITDSDVARRFHEIMANEEWRKTDDPSGN